jgi:putative ABC transport system permease protein
VQSVSGMLLPPFMGALTANFTVEGRPAEAGGTALSAEYHPVALGYFGTMKTALLRGRDFTSRDVAGAPWVAIVNETMARRFWPNENPIGKRIRLDIAPDEQPREIVAVARDAPSSRLQTRQEPAVFVDFVQAPPHIIGPIANTRTQLTFVVRTAGSPLGLVPSLRAAVAEIDRDRPLVDVKTAEQYMGEETQYPRYYSMLLGLFAAVATALAAIGIYGVMAYAMAQRTREIGIRMALGATRVEVARMALGQAAPLIAGGVVAGIVGAAGLTRYLTSELWEVTATDPLTFAVVSVGLAVVAGAACVVPVRRATRVDPIVALRWE